MKEFTSWKDEEVKDLFDLVLNYKQKNKNLLSAFSEHAKKYARKRNSVRNYYYQELSQLKKDKIRARKLNIDLNKHIITTAVSFSEDETEEILTKILTLKLEGYSIRKACLTLANGDVDKMVRFQNKYRSVLKNNPEYISNIVKKLNKEETIEKPNNVIFLKKQEQKTISEKDLNSLFLGLIKLVKRTTAESVQKNLLSELDFSNSTLRKTLVRLSKTEKDLKEKEEDNKKLAQENERLKLENTYLKTEIANFLTNKNQTSLLKEFLKNVKKETI